MANFSVGESKLERFGPEDVTWLPRLAWRSVRHSLAFDMDSAVLTDIAIAIATVIEAETKALRSPQSAGFVPDYSYWDRPSPLPAAASSVAVVAVVMSLVEHTRTKVGQLAMAGLAEGAADSDCCSVVSLRNEVATDKSGSH